MESRRTRRQQHTKPGTGLEWTTTPLVRACVIIGTPTTQPRSMVLHITTININILTADPSRASSERAIEIYFPAKWSCSATVKHALV